MVGLKHLKVKTCVLLLKILQVSLIHSKIFLKLESRSTYKKKKTTVVQISFFFQFYQLQFSLPFMHLKISFLCFFRVVNFFYSSQFFYTMRWCSKYKQKSKKKKLCCRIRSRLLMYFFKMQYAKVCVRVYIFMNRR